MRTLKEDREAAALAATKAEEAKLFYHLFKDERPDLNTQANENLIRQYHGSQRITLETIRQAVQFLETNHKGALSHKSTQLWLSDGS